MGNEIYFDQSSNTYYAGKKPVGKLDIESQTCEPLATEDTVVLSNNQSTKTAQSSSTGKYIVGGLAFAALAYACPPIALLSLLVLAGCTGGGTTETKTDNGPTFFGQTSLSGEIEGGIGEFNTSDIRKGETAIFSFPKKSIARKNDTSKNIKNDPEFKDGTSIAFLINNEVIEKGDKPLDGKVEIVDLGEDDNRYYVKVKFSDVIEAKDGNGSDSGISIGLRATFNDTDINSDALQFSVRECPLTFSGGVFDYTKKTAEQNGDTESYKEYYKGDIRKFGISKTAAHDCHYESLINQGFTPEKLKERGYFDPFEVVEYKFNQSDNPQSDENGNEIFTANQTEELPNISLLEYQIKGTQALTVSATIKDTVHEIQKTAAMNPPIYPQDCPPLLSGDKIQLRVDGKIVYKLYAGDTVDVEISEEVLLNCKRELLKDLPQTCGENKDEKCFDVIAYYNNEQTPSFTVNYDPELNRYYIRIPNEKLPAGSQEIPVKFAVKDLSRDTESEWGITLNINACEPIPGRIKTKLGDKITDDLHINDEVKIGVDLEEFYPCDKEGEEEVPDPLRYKIIGFKLDNKDVLGFIQNEGNFHFIKRSFLDPSGDQGNLVSIKLKDTKTGREFNVSSKIYIKDISLPAIDILGLKSAYNVGDTATEISARCDDISSIDVCGGAKYEWEISWYEEGADPNKAEGETVLNWMDPKIKNFLFSNEGTYRFVLKAIDSYGEESKRIVRDVMVYAEGVCTQVPPSGIKIDRIKLDGIGQPSKEDASWITKGDNVTFKYTISNLDDCDGKFLLPKDLTKEEIADMTDEELKKDTLAYVEAALSEWFYDIAVSYDEANNLTFTGRVLPSHNGGSVGLSFQDKAGNPLEEGIWLPEIKPLTIQTLDYNFEEGKEARFYVDLPQGNGYIYNYTVYRFEYNPETQTLDKKIERQFPGQESPYLDYTPEAAGAHLMVLEVKIPKEKQGEYYLVTTETNLNVKESAPENACYDIPEGISYGIYGIIDEKEQPVSKILRGSGERLTWKKSAADCNNEELVKVTPVNMNILLCTDNQSCDQVADFTYKEEKVKDKEGETKKVWMLNVNGSILPEVTGGAFQMKLTDKDGNQQNTSFYSPSIIDPTLVLKTSYVKAGEEAVFDGDIVPAAKSYRFWVTNNEGKKDPDSGELLTPTFSFIPSASGKYVLNEEIITYTGKKVLASPYHFEAAPGDEEVSCYSIPSPEKMVGPVNSQGEISAKMVRGDNGQVYWEINGINDCQGFPLIWVNDNNIKDIIYNESLDYSEGTLKLSGKVRSNLNGGSSISLKFKDQWGHMETINLYLPEIEEPSIALLDPYVEQKEDLALQFYKDPSGAAFYWSFARPDSSEFGSTALTSSAYILKSYEKNQVGIYKGKICVTTEDQYQYCKEISFPVRENGAE